MNYKLYQCPPKFERATTGVSLVDLATDDRFIMLVPGPLT